MRTPQLMQGRGSAKFCAASLAAAVALLCVSCAEGDRPRSGDAVSTDAVDIAAAVEFGGIVLPDRAEVLGVKHQTGMDESYDLSITTDAAGVDELLAMSQFTAPLGEGFIQYPNVAAGPELSESPLVVSGNDRSHSPDGQRTARHIRVDKREPPITYVHIFVATTP